MHDVITQLLCHILPIESANASSVCVNVCVCVCVCVRTQVGRFNNNVCTVIDYHMSE